MSSVSVGMETQRSYGMRYSCQIHGLMCFVAIFLHQQAEVWNELCTCVWKPNSLRESALIDFEKLVSARKHMLHAQKQETALMARNCELHCEAMWQAHRASLVSDNYWLSNEDLQIVAMCFGCRFCICLQDRTGAYAIHEVVNAGSGPMASVALEAPTGRGHFRRLISAETFDQAYYAYCLSVLGGIVLSGRNSPGEIPEEDVGDWKAFINTMEEFKFPRGQYSEDSSDTSGKFVSVCRTIKGMFPNDGEEMNKNYTRVLQCFFGNSDYTFFTLARRNDFDTCHAHCCFGYLKKKITQKK